MLGIGSVSLLFVVWRAAFCSAFGNHVLSIVFDGTKKQVIGIHAFWVIAFMADKHVGWNFTKVDFIRKAMYEFATINVHGSISCIGRVAAPHLPTLPFPARSTKNRVNRAVLVDLLPKAFFGWAAGVMIVNKAHGLTLDVSPCAICRCGNGRKLPATTMTVTIWNFINREVHLQRIWGIIGAHQKLPFWCHAAGWFQPSLRRFAFGFTSLLYHKTSVMEEEVCHS